MNPAVGFSLADYPGGDLLVFGIGWLGEGVVGFVSQVAGDAVDAPNEVGVGVGHVEAYATSEVACPTDVGVPGMGDGVAGGVGGEEAEAWATVDRGVVFGEVDTHKEEVGKEWFVEDEWLIEPLDMGDSAEASDMVADEVGGGEIEGIDGVYRDGGFGIGEGEIQLLPLVEQATVATGELGYIEFVALHGL